MFARARVNSFVRRWKFSSHGFDKLVVIADYTLTSFFNPTHRLSSEIIDV
ncbi:hypothetical protein PR003_g1189 [Phytophthora rubi]|uniref:Uncharacterized protein n=1 Tax=Phytophthora rubi TaxID=129364 RepID=A0A6A4G1A9_9STRA|nr:hypothetical protein PR002_g1185 [Phytophthora rubi]KAE9051842.1 hypothetical protein PR001_g1047 [Phytophthora rubi]KAE9358551.1 hypothetical protein PR003_g1189 [Phytophthora rubi]